MENLKGSWGELKNSNSDSTDDQDDNLVNYDDRNLSKGKNHEYGGFTFYDDDKSTN